MVIKSIAREEIEELLQDGWVINWINCDGACFRKDKKGE